MWITLKNRKNRNRIGQYCHNQNYVNTRRKKRAELFAGIKNTCFLLCKTSHCEIINYGKDNMEKKQKM